MNALSEMAKNTRVLNPFWNACVKVQNLEGPRGHLEIDKFNFGTLLETPYSKRFDSKVIKTHGF